MISKRYLLKTLAGFSCIFAAALQPSITLADDKDLSVLRDQNTGSVIGLQVDERALASKSAGSTDVLREAKDFIARSKEVLGLQDPARDLKPFETSTDELGTSRVRFNQFYKGLPVYQSSLVVHFDRNRNVQLVTSYIAPALSLDTKPVLREAGAIRIANKFWRQEIAGPSPKAVESKLVIFPSEMILNDRHATPRLAWQIHLVSEINHKEHTYLIDAQKSGSLLFSTSTERHLVGNLRQFVYDCSRATNPNTLAGCTTRSTDPYPYSTPDPLHPGYVFGRRSDVTPTPTPGPSGPCPVNDPLYQGRIDTDVVYEINMQATHDYWLTTFNRDGANRQGGLGYWGGGAQSTRNRTQIYYLHRSRFDHVPAERPVHRLLR